MQAKNIDYAVIGAGVAGLAVAHGLRQKGAQVTVYEREYAGAGASGRALGGLFPFAGHVTSPLAVYQRKSLTMWPELAGEIALLSGVNVAQIWRSYAVGVAQVNIPVLLACWQAVLTRQGVRFCFGVEADVATLQQNHDAVVLAAGWGNAALGARYGIPAMQVIKGQALRARLVDGQEVNTPVKRGSTYVLPTWEPGDVLVGSSSDAMAMPDGLGPDPTVTTRLLREATDLCPALIGAKVRETWVGYRPAQAYGGASLPLLRPLADKLWYVRGLGKLGYCLAPGLMQEAAQLG